MGRQHQGMDRPGVRQVLEGSGEQERMEKTGCKIICDAPSTLAVKGLMMIMMIGDAVVVSVERERERLARVHECTSMCLCVPACVRLCVCVCIFVCVWCTPVCAFLFVGFFVVVFFLGGRGVAPSLSSIPFIAFSAAACNFRIQKREFRKGCHGR